MSNGHEHQQRRKEDMVAIINTALMRTIAAVTGLRARLAEERGQDLLEYALLGGVLAAVIAGTGALIMTGAANAMFTGIANCIDFDSLTVCP